MAPREAERDGAGGQDVLRRAGDASVLILTSLAGGSKHGYALIKDVKDFAGVQLGPGTLYGALDRLERLGLIEALPAEDRRHPYRMTPAFWIAAQSGLYQAHGSRARHQMPPSPSRSRPVTVTRSIESRCARSAATPAGVMR